MRVLFFYIRVNFLCRPVIKHRAGWIMQGSVSVLTTPLAVHSINVDAEMLCEVMSSDGHLCIDATNGVKVGFQTPPRAINNNYNASEVSRD